MGEVLQGMSPTYAIDGVTNEVHSGDEELTMDETRRQYNPALRWIGYLACTILSSGGPCGCACREQRAMSPQGTIQ